MDSLVYIKIFVFQGSEGGGDERWRREGKSIDGVCIFEMRGDICVSVYGWKSLGKALPTIVEKIFQKKGLELALISLMEHTKKKENRYQGRKCIYLTPTPRCSLQPTLPYLPIPY